MSEKGGDEIKITVFTIWVRDINFVFSAFRRLKMDNSKPFAKGRFFTKRPGEFVNNANDRPIKLHGDSREKFLLY